MDQWLRRRVRMCYWKQWKRARNPRRQLLRLGIHPAEVDKATRCQPAGLGFAERKIVRHSLLDHGVEDEAASALLTGQNHG